MGGPGALRIRSQLVAQAYVGECPAYHDVVVPAAGAVGVEVTGRDTPVHQVASCGTIWREVARGRNVVRGERVSEDGEDASAGDVLQRRRLRWEIIENGQLLNIGGVRVPGVKLARGHGHTGPPVVAREHIAVLALEHFRFQGRLNGGADLLLAGPDVPQVYGLVVAVVPQWVVDHVDVHATRQGEGYDQHGRSQVAGLHLGMDPGLEVAVAAEYRRGHQVMLSHRSTYLVRQGAAVADACGAAVADRVETQGFQVWDHTGCLQVVCDHAGAGRHAGLHPGLP